MKYLKNCGVPLLLLSVTFNSCIKSDVFDSVYQNEDFVVSGVDANFDWSMFSTVKLSVKVDDKYDGKYFFRVDVYDKNPLISEDASLFAVGVCKKDLDFNTVLTIPSSVSKIFILQTAPNGNKIVIEKNVDSSLAIDCVFDLNVGEPLTRSTIITKSEKSTLVSDFTNFNIPSDAIEINSNSDIALQSGKNYIIPSGFEFSGNISFNGVRGAKLYIKGTWVVNEGKQLTSNEIIVLNGGLLKPSKKINLDFIETSVLAIQSGGKVTDNDTKYSLRFLNTGSCLYNYGLIESTGDIYVASGGNMLNNGEIYITKFESRHAETKISNNGILEGVEFIFNLPAVENYGMMEVSSINMEQGSFINEKSLICEELVWNRTYVMTGCYIYSDVIKSAQPEINIASNSAITCKTWEMTGTKINFDSYSMINISESCKIYSENSFLKGLGKSYAVMNTPKIVFEGYMVGKFSGNLVVAVDTYNPGEEYTPTYTVSDGVFWAEYNKAPIEIPENECISGVTPGPGEDPSDPKFPILEENDKLFTFVLEDNFPAFGDYDMNDIVVTLDKQSKYINADNNIESIKLDFQLKAVGGTRHLAFAMQLDNVAKGNIKNISIEGRQLSTSLFNVTNNLEANQIKPVIILFDDAHQLLRGDNSSEITNTYTFTSRKDPKSISVNIEFTTPINREDIDLNTLNLFGMTFDNSGNRTEIHAPGYDNTSLFSSDLPNLGTYMWALKVPYEFKYPTETITIMDAYPDFKTWVESNKTQKVDWYKNSVEDKIYK